MSKMYKFSANSYEGAAKLIHGASNNLIPHRLRAPVHDGQSYAAPHFDDAP